MGFYDGGSESLEGDVRTFLLIDLFISGKQSAGRLPCVCICPCISYASTLPLERALTIWKVRVK